MDISEELKKEITPCKKCHVDPVCDKEKWFNQCISCRQVDIVYKDIYKIIDEVCEQKKG